MGHLGPLNVIINYIHRLYMYMYTKDLYTLVTVHHCHASVECQGHIYTRAHDKRPREKDYITALLALY